MRATTPITFATLLVLALAGCGGGGGDQAAPVTDQHIVAGQIVATARSTSGIKPAVFGAGSGVSITGLDGANYVQIILNPIHSLAQTQIAYGSNDELWIADSDTGANRVEVGPYGGNANFNPHPSWFPGGLGLVFSQWDYPSGHFQIFTVNTDGSGLTRQTNEALGADTPVWSPGGSQIAYTYVHNGHFQIGSLNPSTHVFTPITDGTADDQNPVYSTDGSKIYFSHKNGLGTYDIGRASATGGSEIDFLTLAGINSPFHMSISPDGNSMVIDAGGVIYLIALNAFTTSLTLTHPASGETDSFPSFSPDGQWIVYEHDSPSGKSLFKIQVDGSGSANLTPYGASFVQAPSWSPFPARRTLVGTGGPLGTAASGFLFAQNGDVLTSFVSFTCVTPTAAKINPQNSTQSNTNSVFELTGDTVNSLKYMNSMWSGPITVVPGSGQPSAKGALVSFNTTTGRVTLVVPYTVGKRMVSKSGALEYEGTFLPAYDGNGKVISNGGSRLSLDPKSGKLISLR